MAADRTVLVAGGGIAGLAFAIARARYGETSVVLEARPRPEAAGAGIQLGPNGVRILEQLGIAERLQSLAGQPEVLRIFNGSSGQILATLPLGQWIARRHGAPYWTVHRGDLHDVLVATAAEYPEIAVRHGFTVSAARQLNGSVAVSNPSGTSLDGMALIGADGLWSRVRPTIAGPAPPVFAGSAATRTVLPAEASGRLAGAYVGLWLGPGANVVHYPVRGGKETAIVIITSGESWQSSEWDVPTDASSVLQRLARFHSSLVDVLSRAAEYRKWSLHRLAPLPRWSSGRIALIGDAAHPMLPHLAQGGALALEDALVLSDCLHGRGADVAEALVRFEILRKTRAAWVQALSRRYGPLYHLGAPLSWLRNAALRIVPGAWLMAGYDRLYAWRPAPD